MFQMPFVRSKTKLLNRLVARLAIQIAAQGIRNIGIACCSASGTEGKTTIRSFRGHAPQIASSAYVDPQAVVIGDVAIGEDASIWPCAVLRGDYNAIHIGARTSIQDGCVCHIESGRYALTVGSNVTVGHRVVLHGCTVESDCLIGMGSILLNGCKIGSGSIIAAGTLITERMELPPGSLVMGAPGKVRHALTGDERKRIALSAEHYVNFKNDFLAEKYHA